MLPTITAERKTPLLPPMITEDELPDWLILDEEDVRQKVVEEETKRISALSGRRQRKEVRYHDELTENEWLHAVDEGLDPEDIIKQRQEDRAAGKISDNEDQDGSDSDDGKKRKKRRKSRVKKTADDDEPKSKKRRSKAPKAKKEDVDPKVQEQMNELIDFIMTYRDADGRELAKPFIKLPSKNELPDYYNLIAVPVDLKKIKDRLKKNKYKTLDDFTADFSLLISNTQMYNMDGSLIFDDSVIP